MAKLKHKPLIALITATLIGGLGNTILASSPEDPMLFASLRFLIGGIISLYWLPKIFKLPKLIQLASLLEVASIILLILSLSTISVTLATVIGSLTPIASLIINRFNHKQSTPKLILLPISLGLISTILIASQQSSNNSTTWTGITLTVISVALGLTGALINGYYGTVISPWTRTAYTNSLGAVLTLPILLINLTDPNATHPSLHMIIYALLAATLAGTIAKALHLYALQYIPIPAVLQASTLSTVTATITAAIILNQQPSFIVVVGVAIGLTTIFLLSYIIEKANKLN